MSTLKKAWLLLNYKQRKYAFFIFVLMFFAMFLEALSVGIIIPLISILLKGNVDLSIFSYLFTFGKPTGKNLIYIGLSITLIIFLIKNLALVYNLWQQTKFLRNLKFELTNSYIKPKIIIYLMQKLVLANGLTVLYQKVAGLAVSVQAMVHL